MLVFVSYIGDILNTEAEVMWLRDSISFFSQST